MLTQAHLEKLIITRREEAAVLFEAEKYDGAVYLAGYAVELSLKLAILLNGFPETEAEFKVYADAKTHSLELLLKLAGKLDLREDDTFSPDWELLKKNWSVECRYRKIGEMTEKSARMTIDSISRIIEKLRI